MALPENERTAAYRQLGRCGGLSLAANADMRAVAAHARKSSPAAIDYWLKKVDPDHQLDASDREARARAAQRLHYSELARRSARVRGRAS